MEWFIAAVAVAALGVAAMAAAGGMGEMSGEPVQDVYRQDLPESPLTADDLDRVRFGVTLRGYAMEQVDDLLERLGREIGERDARIAALTGATSDEDLPDRVEHLVPGPLAPPSPAAGTSPAVAAGLGIPGTAATPEEPGHPGADDSHRVGLP